jgi:hypothetical protein
MAPRGMKVKQGDQFAVLLDPEVTAVVRGMAKALGKTNPEVIVSLAEQGLKALRAAAAAEDAGLDADAAAVAAMQVGRIDAEVTKHLLDVVNDHLERVAARDWRDAALLASGAATAFRRWADQLAGAHGTTVDRLMTRTYQAAAKAEHEAQMADLEKRLAAQQALADQLVVRDQAEG